MARKQFETLTEQMFYILLALHTPRHGYAVMQYVLELTGGRVQIGPGTLYTLISRFENDGYITRWEDGERKVYELTFEGRKLLNRERERLAALLRDSAAALKETDEV